MDFNKRLRKARDTTEMTVSDLARFLRVPRATVNTWLDGRIPFGPKAAFAEKRLALLEYSIATRKGHYPVPDSLSWKDRVKYVEGMRDDAERHYRVPDVRVAG